MKIYLSGKISGLTLDEARRNFDALAILVKRHHPDAVVVNPLDLNEGVDEDDWKQCMYNCFEAIEDCDAAYFMPNWRYSDGAQAEYYWCQGLGVPCYLVTEKELKR